MITELILEEPTDQNQIFAIHQNFEEKLELATEQNHQTQVFNRASTKIQFYLKYQALKQTFFTENLCITIRI
jgi:hypothetical protein